MGIASCRSQLSNEKTFPPSPRPLYPPPHLTPADFPILVPTARGLGIQQAETNQDHLNHSGEKGTKDQYQPSASKRREWLLEDCHSKLSPFL